MPAYVTKRLDHILRNVEKPGRYTGGEVNAVLKDRLDVRASILLAFPDVYDVGMSYHGFKILYERINAVERWAAERTFAPWPDMERQMRARRMPLFSLETKSRALLFDIVGFTLQHEVNYTNVLNMIDLAGAPVDSAERFSAFPLFIAGGEGALAPEPMAPFIDLFVLGDGEQTIVDLMSLVEVFRESGRDDKADLLRLAAEIPGVYVPSLCDCEYSADGTIKAFRDLRESRNGDAPVVVRQIFDLGQDAGPIKPVIPNLRVIHDRLSIEIKRGCARGCRFCSAGMTTRPVRERTPDQILEIARQGIANTGFDEISLLSLSSADYTCILPTVRMLQEAFEDSRLSVSLPSLRINAFDVSLAEELAQVRKSGFTFAPEAGTERLRAVINKPLDEEAFLSIVEQVVNKGWKTLKFYFMIGLPTETDADLDGIIDLVKRAEVIGRRRWGNGLQINVGLSPFVPKPHTPFQWAAQLPAEELDRRHRYVAARLRGKRISIKGHDRRLSLIEAMLARGDRKVAAVIRRAWELGAKFDGWDEHFRFEHWLRACEESAVDPAFYANRERALEEGLPWDHIDAGPGKAFLRKEWRLALGQRIVPDCSATACAGCDVCTDQVDHVLAAEKWAAPPQLLVTEGNYDSHAGGNGGNGQARRDKAGNRHMRLTPPPMAAPPTEPDNRSPGRRRAPRSDSAIHQRLRFVFSRTGALKYLSHLDVVKVLQLACVRAALEPAYTEGFNPRPKMSFMPPLPLGYETLCDVFDVVLIKPLGPGEALRRLGEQMPEGLKILEVREIQLFAPGPEAALASAHYRLAVPREAAGRISLSAASLAECVAGFLAAEAVPFTRAASARRPERTMDLKRTLLGVRGLETAADGLAVTLSISHRSGEYADPISCLGALLGTDLGEEKTIQVMRTESFFDPEAP